MKLEPLNPRHWEAVEFTDHPLHDAIWTIVLGRDGHVYVGLCLEGSGGGVAQLYQYDTAARRLRHLADMGRVTGEPADSGHATQGKIHFSICQARDGTLYGATHCTTPPKGDALWSPLSMWGDPERSFPGGHIFRHDLSTGESVDFGVITPNNGIPYLMLDEERQCFYGATYPEAHLFRCNLQGREFKDYGRISCWYPISMVFDASGNVYTSDSFCRLIKYDVSQDRLIFPDTRPFVRPWNRDGRHSWITDMCLAEDGWIYGLTYSNGHLFRFDPRQQMPHVEDLGHCLPGMPADRIRCLVPDRNGGIYFIAQVGGVGNVLARYELATGERAAVSLLELGGRRYFAWNGVCGHDGALYFAIGRVPCELLIYRP